MIDFTRIEAITFDCYGTLIDWETGILLGLGPVLEAHGIGAELERVLAAYAAAESAAEEGAYQPYADVLRAVVDHVGSAFGFEPSAAERECIVESLPTWQPFDDTVAALKKLASKYRLGILSNVDDRLFEKTARWLEVDFDWIVTAEQVGSYKPDRRNFRALIERTGVSAESLLHAAQSKHHDVAPASELGLRTCWVDRRAGRDGGATLASSAEPDLVVQDMAELARLAC